MFRQNCVGNKSAACEFEKVLTRVDIPVHLLEKVGRVDDASLRQADFAPGGGKQWRLYLKEILGDCLNKGILKMCSGRNFPKVEITKVVRYGNIQREERPGNSSEDDRRQDNSFSDSPIHLDTTMEMGLLS